MVIFYFHVSDGQTTFRDADGLHYSDLESARAYARRLARDLGDRSSFSGFHVAVHDRLDHEQIRIPVPENQAGRGAFTSTGNGRRIVSAGGMSRPRRRL